MSFEDQNTGDDSPINPTPTESNSTLAPGDGAQAGAQAPEQAPEIQHDNTPINPVSDAIAAIQGKLQGIPDSGAQARAPRQNLGPRNFEGLEPDEIPFFKQMSNQAYAKVYPAYLASKKANEEKAALQKELDEMRGFNLYEAEGAWKLAPEYSELSQARARIEGEAQYWQDQLTKIETGEKWRPLMQSPDGRLYAGDEQEPTPQARALILGNLTKANQYLMQADNDLAQFEGQFKDKHKGYVSTLSSLESQVISAKQKESIKSHIDETLKKFPSYVRNKPEVQLAATLWVLNQGLIKLVQSLRGGNANAVMQARTAQNSGQRQVAAGGSGGGTVQDVIERFNQVRRGGVVYSQ